MRNAVKALKDRIHYYKMRKYWGYSLTLIRDGMDVQIRFYEGQREWKKKKGDQEGVKEAEIILRVLTYWRKEVDSALTGNGRK